MHLTATEAHVPRYRLVMLRKNRGLSQRQVAAELGITDTHLGLLERGKSDPSVELLFRIARYYGCDVYEAWSDLAGSKPDSTINPDK